MVEIHKTEGLGSKKIQPEKQGSEKTFGLLLVWWTKLKLPASWGPIAVVNWKSSSISTEDDCIYCILKSAAILVGHPISSLSLITTKPRRLMILAGQISCIKLAYNSTTSEDMPSLSQEPWILGLALSPRLMVDLPSEDSPEILVIVTLTSFTI